LKWTPNILTGTLIVCGMMIVVVLIDVGLLWRVVSGPANGVTFACGLFVLLSLPTVAWLAYRGYNLTQLRYEFDRNRLVITTGAIKQIVPMSSIERVVDGGEAEARRVRGLTWAGYAIGHGWVKGIGQTLFYATTPLQEQAIVVTPTVAYGITVPDMDSFRESFDRCRQMGPSLRIQQATERAAFVQWPVWKDTYTQGVLLGCIALNALLFALLLFSYPDLPAAIPLHYDMAGQVDRIGPRSELFTLPVIASVTLAMNGVIGMIFYRRERMISYLAWSGAAVVQGLFLLALWNIIR